MNTKGTVQEIVKGLINTIQDAHELAEITLSILGKYTKPQVKVKVEERVSKEFLFTIIKRNGRKEQFLTSIDLILWLDKHWGDRRISEARKEIKAEIRCYIKSKS